jgi:hypothetical protein
LFHLDLALLDKGRKLGGREMLFEQRRDFLEVLLFLGGILGVGGKGLLALFEGQLSLFVGGLELQHASDEVGWRLLTVVVFKLWG